MMAQLNPTATTIILIVADKCETVCQETMLYGCYNLTQSRDISPPRHRQ